MTRDIGDPQPTIPESPKDIFNFAKKLARSGERGDYSPDSSNWVFS